MRASLLFYTISEFEDDIKYCKRKGFIPHKIIMKQLDGQPVPVVVQYSKGGYIYDVLESDQCYSGYMITLARVPQLTYDKLLDVALASKYLDERAGAVGTLLKKHSTEFENYLLTINQEHIQNKTKRKQIVRMTSFVYDFVRVNTSYVWNMHRVMVLCEELIQRYKGTGQRGTKVTRGWFCCPLQGRGDGSVVPSDESPLDPK